MRRLNVEEIPELPGYMTVAAIADKYHVHKGTVYYMITNSLSFGPNAVFKASKGTGDDQRPLLLVRTDAVTRVFAKRAKDFKPVTDEYATAINDWNRRVKQWGRDSGWTLTPIRTMGPPQHDLMAAYLRENPGDMRPEIDPVTEQANPDADFEQALTDWSQRVKNWGIATGWTTTRIRAYGVPNKTLVDAYLAQNPDDLRPRRGEFVRQFAGIDDGAEPESH